MRRPLTEFYLLSPVAKEFTRLAASPRRTSAEYLRGLPGISRRPIFPAHPAHSSPTGRWKSLRGGCAQITFSQQIVIDEGGHVSRASRELLVLGA